MLLKKSVFNLPVWLWILASGLLLKVLLDWLFWIAYDNYRLVKELQDYLPLFAAGIPASYFIARIRHRNPSEHASPVGIQVLRWISGSIGLYAGLTLFRYLIVLIPMPFDISPSESLFVISGFVHFEKELIVFGASSLVTALRAVTLAYHDQKIRLRESVRRLETFRREQTEFRLGMLQAQIDPHFLFNSLNTLASLVQIDQEAAAGFTRKLAGLYREILAKSREDLHTLAEERSLLERYMELVQIRFPERIRCEIDLKSELAQKKIAPLTFQMLAENAIKHNSATREKPLLIRIYLNGQGLLCFENTLQKRETLAEGEGIGLDNIRKRYLLLTGKEIRVKEEEGIFAVLLPLID